MLLSDPRLLSEYRDERESVLFTCATTRRLEGERFDEV